MALPVSQICLLLVFECLGFLWEADSGWGGLGVGSPELEWPEWPFLESISDSKSLLVYIWIMAQITVPPNFISKN